MLRCVQCSRPNPDGSLYCCFDGRSLGAMAAKPAAVGRFATPFVFPLGKVCGTFDDLARACLEDWPTALRLLGDGTYIAFFNRIGRLDLASLARQAATFPDADAGLDEMLRGWPTESIAPARLHIDQTRLDIGRVAVGQRGEWRLRLKNEGMGLLRGTIRSDVPWLSVGDGAGGASRYFGCLDSTTLPIRLVGSALRASAQRMVGRITVAFDGVGPSVSRVPARDRAAAEQRRGLARVRLRFLGDLAWRRRACERPFAEGHGRHLGDDLDDGLAAVRGDP